MVLKIDIEICREKVLSYVVRKGVEFGGVSMGEYD